MRGFLLKIALPVVVLGLLLIAGSVGYYLKAINQPRDFGDDIVVFAPGDTLHAITMDLQEKGIISEPYTIKIKAYLDDLETRMQAGEYRFAKKTSIAEFLDHLVKGKGQIGVKVTIIEGWTFDKMRKALGQQKKLKHLTTNWSERQIMEKLGHADLYPEGQFYPDTYYYRVGDTDLSIYESAFSLMQKKLDQAWANRSEGIMLKNRYEALILASIIEKETQYLPEQPIISGVLNNRLKKGMRLQVDPTVIYGLGEQYKGNITRKHLKSDTPYNTYTRYGLPPTPISLPGMGAIDAAVNPAKTDAYYFVAKGEGRHHFSKTLKEHNRAVRKFILGKK